MISNLPGHVYWKDRNGVYLVGCDDKQAKSLELEYGYQVIGKTDFELPWKEEDARRFCENDLYIIERNCQEVFEESAIVDGKPATVLST